MSSLRAEFAWSVDRDGFNVKGDGDFRVQVPSKLDLDAHYEGSGEVPSHFAEQNDSQVLVTGQSIYVNSPALGEDWYSLTAAQFGADYAVTQRLITQRSPLNLVSVRTGLSLMAYQGNEEIDGTLYARVRASVDVGTLMDALADTYGSQGQLMLANRYAGPVAVEFLIDPAAKTLRRVHASGGFSYLGGETQISLTVDYIDLNRLTDFPAPPEDAVPIA